MPHPNIGQGAFLVDTGELQFYYGAPPSWRAPWNSPYFTLPPGGGSSPLVTDVNGNVLTITDAVATYKCQASTANPAVTTTFASYGSLDNDPNVTVPVSSHAQVLVVCGCDIAVVAGSTGAAMSFDIVGVGVSILANDLRAAQFGAAPVALAFSTAATRLFTAADGLLPNVPIVVTAKYRSDGTNVCTFSNRFIFAIPL